MPVSFKLDKHLNNLGYYLLEGYLLFPTVPRNVGSVMSVNEHEHFKDRLTIWLCTKMLRLRVVPSLWWYLLTLSPNNWFYWNREDQEIGGQTYFQPPASYLFDIIQSQWKLALLLWATSWNVLAVQIWYSPNVNAIFKGFGTKSNYQPLVKVLVFIDWCDRTNISPLERKDNPKR